MRSWSCSRRRCISTQTLVWSETGERHTCASNWEVSEACARLPEETHDEGAGEQGDEGQAVTQRGQNLHHPVEEQLHTNKQTNMFTDGGEARLPGPPRGHAHTHTHAHRNVWERPRESGASGQRLLKPRWTPSTCVYTTLSWL